MPSIICGVQIFIYFTSILKKWGTSILDFHCPKCSKISYTKVADKMAYSNSADPDQTAPEAAV